MNQNDCIGKPLKQWPNFVDHYISLNQTSQDKPAPKKTTFLWQANRLIAETNHKEHYRSFVYEPGTYKPLAQLEGKGKTAEVYYYHLDHLGTPQELTSTTGKLVWAVQYRAYGNVVRTIANDIETPLRFQGQYFDAESGLHYNRHRYYQPETGRFLTPDPIKLAGGLNNYQYVPNPVNWVDPLGLECVEGNDSNQKINRPNNGLNTKESFMARSNGIFKNQNEADKAFELWEQGKWPELENMMPPDSWPPNRGAISTVAQELQPGSQIDRFGGRFDNVTGKFSDTGGFVAPAGSSFESRALPQSILDNKGTIYSKYEVLKPIPNEKSQAIPWFGQKGMGTQHDILVGDEKTGDTGINYLLNNGYIKLIYRGSFPR